MKHMIKRKQALKDLRQDILTEYKAMMQKLAVAHRDVPADDVRLEIASTVMQHTLNRTKDRLHRKVRKPKTIVINPKVGLPPKVIGNDDWLDRL